MRPRGLALLIYLVVSFSLFAEEAVTLAVMKFKSNTADGSTFLGESFSETMATKLAGIRQIHLYERGQFEKIASELQMAQQSEGLFDESTVQHVGRIVAIDYMLLGSVTQLGGTVQVESRLINVNTGRVELAKDLRGAYPDDVFDLQDRIALDISGALKLRLSALDRERITRDPTENMDAYDLYNRAIASGSSGGDRVRLLRNALKRDPEFHMARHFLAETLFSNGDLRGAEQEYGLLLENDPGDYKALYNSALLAFDAGDLAEAAGFLDRCTNLRPQDADAWYHRGLICEFSPSGERLGPGCDLTAAMNHYEEALSANPRHFEALYASGLLSAMFAQGEEDPEIQLTMLETAVERLSLYLEVNPEAWNAAEVEENVVMLSTTVDQLEEYLEG